MQTLHVRSVPNELYERLRTLAQIQQRSLSAQVVVLLDRAVQEEEARLAQADLLETIRRRRFTPPAEAPDAVTLLRQDRER